MNLATLSLQEQYDWHCGHLSDIYVHLPRFVDFVEILNAQHVIELGSRSGLSTVAWLFGLERTGGHLTSVDLDAAPDIGTFDHWRHIQGNDQSPEVLAELEPADIIFIDTSHHYGETMNELNLYRWLVKPGGIICGHDTENEWPEGAPLADGSFPVKRAVREFAEANGYDTFFYPDCWGLFMMRGF